MSGEGTGTPTASRALPKPTQPLPRLWFLVVSKQTLEQKEATGLSPIISLFAELLFKVAQGQALRLQHPPVWNLFSTEKVSDDQLAGLEHVDPCWLLWLFVTENKMQRKLSIWRQQANTRKHTRVYTLQTPSLATGWGPVSQRQPSLANIVQLQVTSKGHTGGDNSFSCTDCYCFSRYHLKEGQSSLFQVGTQGCLPQR